MRGAVALFSAGLALAAVACQPNAPLREVTSACAASPGNGESCASHSLEEQRVESYPDQSFLLGFVEFDDQGKPYIRDQVTTLFERIALEAQYRDLCIVIFVHGWKHNDAATDTNVMQFRRLLGQMAKMELERPPGPYWPSRKVVGIYVGWRGLSFSAGEIGENLTFWTRMATAHRVAEGSVREVLARAKSLRDAIDATSWPGHQDPRNTRLVTIGHSFGGLIVYTALAQYFIDRVVQAQTAPFPGSLAATRAPGGPANEIAGYGDLVVIVNPAIEAMRYQPLRELLENYRGANRFAPRQNPVLVEVTSTADWATGIAFPLGRTLNTTFENFTSGDERKEAMAALGHYPAFWTHDLVGPTAEADPNLPLPPIDPYQECVDFEAFSKTERLAGYLRPGWRRHYRAGAVLSHRADSNFDPNDPLWVITTDRSMIRDHNDIEEPVFVDFVRQVYDDLVRLKEREPCRPTPAAARLP